MTLDEILALLPDNTSGEISAADLRTICTDLWTFAHFSNTVYAYSWSTGGTAPTAGHITLDAPWQMTATKALISETTDDGLTIGFGLVNQAETLWITDSSGVKLTADTTGPSVDLGTYREVPITVREIVGPQPANNGAVMLTVGAVVS